MLPSIRAEWRSLPPIQRVVAEHPLINPVQRFSSSLTSWRSPAYLEPLGHRVGPAEPAGVIDGLARPRTTEGRAPDMPVVQRSVRKRGVLSRLWGMSVQRAAEPDSPVFESPAPEPDSASAQPLPDVRPHEEPLPDEPGPVFEPTATVVLPAVAAASREADPPPMPLTSAGPSAVSVRPPVRTVQAIRAETPSAPLHTPIPAVEPSRVDTPVSVELPPTETSEPDRGPIVPMPAPMAPAPRASEPELAEAEPLETVPVRTPEPLPAEPPAEPPASEVVRQAVEPSRPALPVVQRTEQSEASPRRLGLGAPILPDSVHSQASVPLVAAADAPSPAVEDSVAEVDAPLAGAVEPSVLPTSPAEENSVAAPDEVPRPVARIVAGEERMPPAASVSATSRETPTAVQRTVIEPAPELPTPKHQDVPRSGTPVQKPVQRLRDEAPSPGSRHIGSPREPVETRENAPDARISVSRAVEPPPNLPTVTLSRSSPGNTFRPLEPPQIRSGTTEISEPPATPGGSVNVPPASTTSTSLLPVARFVDAAVVASPVPAAVTLPVSRVIEAPARITSLLPSAGVADGSTPTTIQRTREPVTLSPVIQRKETGAVHLPPTVLPAARSADSVEPAPNPPKPNTSTLVSSERTGLTELLPVARIAEAVPAGVHSRQSTRDVLRTVQRTVPSETVDHGDGLVLNLPPVVTSRQAEAPVVQREPEAAPPSPVAPPVAEPVPKTQAPAPAAPAAQPETEELVKKLFDPLLRRLKTELRLDRERRGALTDRPH
ncbi:hypothetical protein ACFQ05_18405 [Amycolatopsis umgeniensis]|uniref:Uncharacterized protein n=1 Tax=Amycolatopsis umgeniensis TaxID=336628 RepID=A0A841BFA6_9PSEU|nr:hypothetical protein [Amycolatopsis umgeniensis]MBB5857581.1 hypothetical protein [Amycolatopsis umgeniensis]